MKQVTVAKLIEFNRKSSKKSKETFVRNLSKPKESTDGGGDYWITSSSAVARAYWNRDKIILDEKIDELQKKANDATYKPTADQYKANISNLETMNDFDFVGLAPDDFELNHLKEATKGVIRIGEVEIAIRPQLVYSFGEEDNRQMAAVWFVAKKGGYTDGELGVFAECLYNLISQRYGEKYDISEGYVTVVDITRGQDVTYQAVKERKVPVLLNGILTDLNSF